MNLISFVASAKAVKSIKSLFKTKFDWEIVLIRFSAVIDVKTNCRYSSGIMPAPLIADSKIDWSNFPFSSKKVSSLIIARLTSSREMSKLLSKATDSIIFWLIIWDLKMFNSSCSSSWSV